MDPRSTKRGTREIRTRKARVWMCHSVGARISTVCLIYPYSPLCTHPDRHRDRRQYRITSRTNSSIHLRRLCVEERKWQIFGFVASRMNSLRITRRRRRNWTTNVHFVLYRFRERPMNGVCCIKHVIPSGAVCVWCNASAKEWKENYKLCASDARVTFIFSIFFVHFSSLQFPSNSARTRIALRCVRPCTTGSLPLFHFITFDPQRWWPSLSVSPSLSQSVNGVCSKRYNTQKKTRKKYVQSIKFD